MGNNNQYSPLPSLIREGVINRHPELVSGSHEMQLHRSQSDLQRMLKRVQDDMNIYLKRTYSLINLLSYSPRKHCAFTLAEVLITLGIIGVVAAMTMPSLIQNYQKKQTAVRLERFYSIMSQAILRWQQDEGLIPDDMRFSSDMIQNGADTEKWYNDTIGKYIQSISKGVTKDNKGISVAFNDGSGFDAYIQYTTQINIFFCTDYKYCRHYGEGNFDGKHGFLFTINQGKFYASLPGHQNSTREQLLNGCKYGNTDNSSVSSKDRRHACARLIQFDGWEIKDDYPWNQTMLEND